MNIWGRYIIRCLFVLAILFPMGEGFSQSNLSVIIDELDTSNFPEIRIVFRVLKGSAAVGELEITDFTVTENGAIQVISGGCDDSLFINPASIMLCLDRSGSINQSWNTVQNAAKNFVSNSNNDDEFAVYSFGGRGVTPTSTFCLYKDITYETDWTTNKNAVNSIIDNIDDPCGNTPLWETIITGTDHFADRTKKRVMIVLTDGQDSYNTYTNINAISAAQARNITLYSIGLGVNVDEGDLTMLSQATGGKFYNAPTASELDDIYKSITQELTPTGDCEITYTCLLDCYDGSEVTINLSVASDVGTGSASTSFTLPYDTTTFTYVNVKSDRDFVVDADNEINIPLTLTRVSTNRTSGNYEIDVDYNTNLLELRNVTTTEITNGYAASFTPTATGATITLQGSPAIADTGDIALLTFYANGSLVSDKSELTISEPRTGLTCSHASASNGLLTVNGYCERSLYWIEGDSVQTKVLANSPNPFNPGTSIAFTIGKAGLTTMKVFDAKGTEVATLVNETLEPGEYTRYFDAEGFPNGPYYVHLENNGDSSVRRIVLLK